jgi:hypothetical protein
LKARKEALMFEKKSEAAQQVKEEAVDVSCRTLELDELDGVAGGDGWGWGLISWAANEPGSGASFM